MIRIYLLLALLSVSALGQQAGERRIILSPAAWAAYKVTLRGMDDARSAKTDGKNDEIPIEPDDADKGGRTVIDVEITGETARATTRTPDGKTNEIYMFRELFLLQDKNSERVRAYKFDQYAPSEMRFTHNFPGVDWVRPEYFKGKVERRGIACFHFVQEGGTGETTPLNKDDALAYDNRRAQSRREAWFDSATGLPVAFKDGGTEGSFRHGTAGKKPIQLPKPCIDAVRYYYGRR